MDLPEPVAEFFDATNAGDVDRFVAAFAADGVIDDWGREFPGADRIREWTEGESIGVDQTFEVTSFRIDGGAVVVIADVGGGGFTGASTFTFTLNDDRSAIRRMTITA